MADEERTVSFKETLNLPRTDFPIRPQPAIDDPAMIIRWHDDELYEKSFHAHGGAKKYVLHVGPPYANGHIHLGHAYDWILKDILTKAYRMAGYHVPVKPGWDCHGLPIEIKVAKENPDLSALELKKACRAYAQHWVEVQSQEFQRLGILMDWAHPYLTMSPHYEAKTVQAFGRLLEQGFIERKNKTVPWCFVDQTVLAAAEIEYKDRKDPSVYALFPLDPAWVSTYVPGMHEAVSLIVWTTTPWTLPLNRAVLLKAGAQYVLARLKGQLAIVGYEALPRVAKLIDAEPEVIQVFPAELLASARVYHPLSDYTVPVIFDESVDLAEGTACVHIAPGCGQLDYELGVKHGLEIYSPISLVGTYTEGIVPAELQGKSVTEGQGWVIAELARAGRLFYKGTITHSYPHCWRCHNGLIFRATRQWFFNLAHKSVKQRAVDATDTISFLPPQGRNFLRATLESRWEWCLSRQRTWGTPIPALMCATCDYVYCTPEFVDRVAQSIAVEGVEYWERVPVSELLLDHPITCPHCETSHFVKEKDILDVWFDAGVSHYVMLYNNPELSFPADIYLEGIDQHRGWFQSALLTGLVLEGQAPMKAIMTHGFTVDEKGQKMSKSLGNVVAPMDVMAQLGTDGLRLWVASVGHEGDAVISDVLLKNVGEVLRKIRNTARFLLSNLYDFTFDQDHVAVDKLVVIDRAILAYAALLNQSVIGHYKAGNFTAVFHGLADFVTVYLSSWYLDVIKDRLYVEKADGYLRRSAQTACWYLLDMLTRLMAPIMSFTAEQLSDQYQKDKSKSVHLQLFAELPEVPVDVSLGGSVAATREMLGRAAEGSGFIAMWELLRELRSWVLKAIEIEREKGLIKHSLEARVTLFASPAMKGSVAFGDFLKLLATHEQSVEDFFKEFLIVSQVVFASQQDDLPESGYKGWYVRVEHALGAKCPRCWNWDVGERSHQLCRRCSLLV